MYTEFADGQTRISQHQYGYEQSGTQIPAAYQAINSTMSWTNGGWENASKSDTGANISVQGDGMLSNQTNRQQSQVKKAATLGINPNSIADAVVIVNNSVSKQHNTNATTAHSSHKPIQGQRAGDPAAVSGMHSLDKLKEYESRLLMQSSQT